MSKKKTGLESIVLVPMLAPMLGPMLLGRLGTAMALGATKDLQPRCRTNERKQIGDPIPGLNNIYIEVKAI